MGQRLARRRGAGALAAAQTWLAYLIAFDMLRLRGENLTAWPYSRRRAGYPPDGYATARGTKLSCTGTFVLTKTDGKESATITYTCQGNQDSGGRVLGHLKMSQDGSSLVINFDELSGGWGGRSTVIVGPERRLLRTATDVARRGVRAPVIGKAGRAATDCRPAVRRRCGNWPRGW